MRQQDVIITFLLIITTMYSTNTRKCHGGLFDRSPENFIKYIYFNKRS